MILSNVAQHVAKNQYLAEMSGKSIFGRNGQFWGRYSKLFLNRTGLDHSNASADLNTACPNTEIIRIQLGSGLQWGYEDWTSLVFKRPKIVR